ncbi:DUF2711 family protein [Bacillus infantis]|uniref:DUF2711 family protein n=1 Tax=Bacillus infantis TaxID=324767 RepID=A0A5D4RFL3_9BACI|nr:DUF2711 family protein [Bacillus infantis]TYS48674.1 DUF2711 family protein [Bacillus infantis]
MIKMRKAPEPHKFAVCSPADMPIKKFYEGVFEEVFIFFHPFFKPETIDYDLFNPDTYPAKSEIRDDCEMVSWKQFMEISNITSYEHVDIGLRTMILGLNKTYANEEIAKVIHDTCDQHKIIYPTEGYFPELIMDKLLQGIKNIGYDWIWRGDEFCSKRKLEYIDDLIEDANLLEIEDKNLFTHDNNILLTTHWDSHFSLLCSNKKTVNILVDFCDLEGFYCRETTEIYWSVRN